MKNWIVIGGGFKGITAAYYLKEQGCDVTVLDMAPFLGGILSRGFKWEGFNVDIGCHLFDNTDADTTRFLLKILSDVQPVEVKYASYIECERSEGFSIPDLSVLKLEEAEILKQLVDASCKVNNISANYSDYLIQRFGSKVGHLLIRAANKKMACNTDNLSVEAKHQILFDRIRLFDEEKTAFLKQHPVFNEKLAQKSNGNSMKFYPEAESVYPHRNFHPGRSGMKSFGVSAQEYLTEQGIKFRLGSKVNSINDKTISLDNKEILRFDNIFWALDASAMSQVFFGENCIKDFVHNVAIVFFYFKVPLENISSYTYLHDHSPDTLIFRASTTGKYTNQVIDGNSFICCEVPTKVKSDVWVESEKYASKVWQEACDIGIVTGNFPLTQHILKAPVTFKLAKIGYKEKEHELLERVKRVCPNIVSPDMNLVSKQEIARYIQSTNL